MRSRKISRRHVDRKTYEWLRRNRHMQTAGADEPFADERSLARQCWRELAAVAVKWAPYLRNLPPAVSSSRGPGDG